ncbi:hypothetical protein BGX26_001124 [Mortierella sp. AD094]|nr:hypothetical protein BGX26_001124 [Mortierella sp. AD094]
MTVEIDNQSLSTSKPTPTTAVPQKRHERIDIGDGLIMRWSTRDDAENVARCLAVAFRWMQRLPQLKEGEEPEPYEAIHAAGKRLLRGNSGVMSEFDYALVENTLAKDDEIPIVACICLHGTMGYYGKTQFTFGRPEVVGCLPEYRSRGLIRRLFLEMIHPASDARGDVIQTIPGIPYFYRQFGYEYGVTHRSSRRIDNIFTAIPDLDLSKQGEEEKKKQQFLLRSPTLDDIPYLVKMSTPEKLLNQAEIGLVYDEAYWKYTIHDLIETAESRFDICRESKIIVDAKTGQDCGIVVTKSSAASPDPIMAVLIFVLQDGYRYRDALYPVLGQMIEIANQPNVWEQKEQKRLIKNGGGGDDDGQQQDTESKPENNNNSKKRQIQSLAFHLDPNHPVMNLLKSKSKFCPMRLKLYIRILSYAQFILKVAPTLEERLEKSHLAGISVTLHFNFFKKVEGSSGKGLEIVFKDGKIISASDDWVSLSPENKYQLARERITKAKQEGTYVELDANAAAKKKPLEYDAEFGPLNFTRLVLGDLSVEQMLDLYGDARVHGGEDAETLLDILFPKQQAHFDMFWW